MPPRSFLAIAVAALCAATPAAACPAPAGGLSLAALPFALQCVPYARARSGIQIFGDAHTWWDQAKGHYPRGFVPRIGAVMAFRPHGKMVLGHVAYVSGIIDSRTVLLSHANWSPIDGHTGRIERNVRALDVSPGNDWSRVRVWFAPRQGLGSTAWPVEGFIYNTVYDDGLARPGRGRQGRSRENLAGDPIGAIIAAFVR